jgi:hypothetical protein
VAVQPQVKTHVSESLKRHKHELLASTSYDETSYRQYDLYNMTTNNNNFNFQNLNITNRQEQLNEQLLEQTTARSGANQPSNDQSLRDPGQQPPPSSFSMNADTFAQSQQQQQQQQQQPKKASSNSSNFFQDFSQHSFNLRSIF